MNQWKVLDFEQLLISYFVNKGMGFDESLVKIVMQEQKEKCGFGFDSTTALFEAVTIEQRYVQTKSRHRSQAVQ